MPQWTADIEITIEKATQIIPEQFPNLLGLPIKFEET
jgi:hypothetical protein